jgi:hypothetical protein
MKNSAKVLIVTAVVAIVGFLTEPNGPLGAFWATHPSVPAPAGIQVPLFMILGAVEAIALGLGISFLIFGYPTLSTNASVSAPLTRGAHLSIVWLLSNWWAHDSLHLHNALELNGLLSIEYGFHVTLIVGGLILVRYFMATSRLAAPV